MVQYPGNRPVELTLVRDPARGDAESLSHLEMSVHTGTHLDVQFVPDYSYLAVDAAELLAATRVCLVGIDYLSIGRGETNPQVHRILLGAGIVIVEGPDLSQVPAGRHDLICLPLRLVGRDGAPARALLRPHAS